MALAMAGVVGGKDMLLPPTLLGGGINMIATEAPAPALPTARQRRRQSACNQELQKLVVAHNTQMAPEAEEKLPSKGRRLSKLMFSPEAGPARPARRQSACNQQLQAAVNQHNSTLTGDTEPMDVATLGKKMSQQSMTDAPNRGEEVWEENANRCAAEVGSWSLGQLCAALDRVGCSSLQSVALRQRIAGRRLVEICEALGPICTTAKVPPAAMHSGDRLAGALASFGERKPLVKRFGSTSAKLKKLSKECGVFVLVALRNSDATVLQRILTDVRLATRLAVGLYTIFGDE